MKGLKKAGWLAVVLIVAMGLFCSSARAEVTVYAEGAYTNSDLVVYVYADINPNPDPILSYGVRMTYNTSELAFPPVASLNEEVWYMGSPPPNNHECNHCVDTSVAGEVILVGPRLDTSTPTSPTEGVSGNRVLLGSVKFNRSSTTTPITNPETFFNIQLSLGKTNPNPSYKFVNFASTQGEDLDTSVVFGHPGYASGANGVIVRQRGDANADGKIDSADAQKVREIFFKMDLGGYRCFADANDDDKIDSADAQRVREIFFKL